MSRHRAGERPGIDWSDVRRRVDAAGRAIAGESRIPPELVPALLEERARALARPVIDTEPADSPRLISFSLAGELYGIEPRRVMEICRLGHLVPLPRAEPWVAGLTGWRGELVLVIDLRLLLGAEGSPRGERPTLLVLGEDRPLLGVLADAPGELLAISPHDLRAPPDGVSGKEYIRGMTTDTVLVLDVDRVLDAVGSETA
jgi:purine-binding chemotaxis protein CheW